MILGIVIVGLKVSVDVCMSVTGSGARVWSVLVLAMTGLLRCPQW